MFLLIYGAFSLAGFLFPIDENWYNQLDKPAWTPSGGTIGIIWMILFTFIAFSITFAVWKISFSSLPNSLITVFILNYLLNQLFSFFQFEQKDLLLAFIDCIFVSITSVMLSVLLWKVSKLCSLLLVPYILWSSFATFLAFTIYRMNPAETMFY